jgi:hypothetical protein
MSRYDFVGIHPETRVTIGWDRPLQTFFVQVMKTTRLPSAAAAEDTDDHTILWIGTNFRELPCAADAIRVARAHAVLPADIGATLEMDRLRTIGDCDGPAQHAARPFLSGGD